MNYESAADELLRQFFLFRRRDPLRPEGKPPLDQGEMGALFLLNLKGEPQNPSRMSEILEVNTSRIAAILNSLEKKGFVQRTKDPSDGRKISVSITEQGRSFLQKGHDEVQQKTLELLRVLDERDLDDLLRILKKLNEQQTQGNDQYAETVPKL